ncbi:MAG TPA: hypothetical protein VL283_02880 [Candidatus Baltobacteraceae bacterium]|nr:hypothetical protein [Candidatus Baltobacteraceae bacterium]
MTRSALFLAAVALGACGDNGYDLYEAEPASFRTVTFWVDPHPDVPADLARQACESWYPEGVLCALAPSSEEALIRIHAFEGACVEIEGQEGAYPLGHAVGGGDITLEIECMRKFGGTPIAERVLWPVVAHEVGHELGIWDHVPTDCGDPEVLMHPEGGPVCGTALMNPMIHYGLEGILIEDHYAFDLRDEDWSVLRLAPDEGCTFVAKE